MMILATDNPLVEHDGPKLTVTVPSGKDELQIALTLHQAEALSRRLRVQLCHAWNALHDTYAGAEIVAFRAKRKAGRK